MHSGVWSQNQEIQRFLRPSKILSFKMDELVIGYRKGYFVDHCGTETLKPTSSFKMSDRLTQSPLCVAQHCSALVFPLQKCSSCLLEKTQSRQYGHLKWVLRSNERTQQKETFYIYELNRYHGGISNWICDENNIYRFIWKCMQNCVSYCLLLDRLIAQYRIYFIFINPFVRGSTTSNTRAKIPQPNSHPIIIAY